MSFPIQNFSKYDKETAEIVGPTSGFGYTETGSGSLSDVSLLGCWVDFNFKHIFDNRFVLGGGLGLGSATLAAGGSDYEDLFDFSLDFSLGYAVVNTERVTLILSGIAGWRYAVGGPQEMVLLGVREDGAPVPVDAYTTVSTFNIGAEIFANFKLGERAGLFASCKVTRGVGDLEIEYEDMYANTLTDTVSGASGVCVTPSVGVSFKL